MDQMLEMLMGLYPAAESIFVILGAIVFIGTFVDTMIDDEKDKGFMKKLMNIPILGMFLEAMKKFSPFNTKDKEEPKE